MLKFEWIEWQLQTIWAMESFWNEKKKLEVTVLMEMNDDKILSFTEKKTCGIKWRGMCSYRYGWVTWRECNSFFYLLKAEIFALERLSHSPYFKNKLKKKVFDFGYRLHDMNVHESADQFEKKKLIRTSSTVLTVAETYEITAFS